MNEYRKKLLKKYLSSDYLNDYDNLDNLNPEYVAWCKIKIRSTNYELSKDKNLMKFLNK